MANNITNNMTTQNDGHVASGMRHAEIAAHNCSGLTFKMTANITYTHTTDWDDAESTENNYTAIGRYGDLDTDLDFNGHFDGQGHTVSGIRIYKSGNDINTDSF